MTNEFGTLISLDKPPSYAYPSVNVMLGTYCGITIDAAARVVDVFDEPIQGLYVGGGVSRADSGAAYMTVRVWARPRYSAGWRRPMHWGCRYSRRSAPAALPSSALLKAVDRLRA